MADGGHAPGGILRPVVFSKRAPYNQRKPTFFIVATPQINAVKKNELNASFRRASKISTILAY